MSKAEKDKLIEAIALEYCWSQGYEFTGESILLSRNPRAIEAVSHAIRVVKKHIEPLLTEKERKAS
jgi:hypothetical protein